MDQKAAQINKAVRARRGDKNGACLGLCRWHFGLCAVGRPAAEQPGPGAVDRGGIRHETHHFFSLLLRPMLRPS